MLGCITVHITTVPPGRTPAGSGRSPVTSSCSVADAAAAPSFASARRREAADRAQTATTALLDLRSVSQWVRRVYQPELRRETDRSLSSPATAVCIPHVCESRPHATRCACAVHGMKCGWRARDVRVHTSPFPRVLRQTSHCETLRPPGAGSTRRGAPLPGQRSSAHCPLSPYRLSRASVRRNRSNGGPLITVVWTTSRDRLNFC